MSKSFSSMQFEDPYRPGYGLPNWEVPRTHKPMPDARTGKTQVVATDRGHLKPGAARRSLNNPWGEFKGTWDMPSTIRGPRTDISTARSFFGVKQLFTVGAPQKRTQEMKQMQRMNEVVKAGGAARFEHTKELDISGKTPSPIPAEERGAAPPERTLEPPPHFPSHGERTPSSQPSHHAPLDLVNRRPMDAEDDIPYLPHGPGFLPAPPLEPFLDSTPYKATPPPPPSAPQPQDNPAGNEIPHEEPTNPPQF